VQVVFAVAVQAAAWYWPAPQVAQVAQARLLPLVHATVSYSPLAQVAHGAHMVSAVAPHAAV
jgi:hypothetical protein